MHPGAGPRRLTVRATVLLGGVLLAGCGGDAAPKRSAAVNAPLRVALAYADCIRSHGVPDFPDPDGQGDFTIKPTAAKPDLRPNSPALQAGMRKCGPVPSGSVTPAEEEAAFHSQLKTARCMQTHGVPDYPLPQLVTTPGKAGSILLHYNGIDPNAPNVQRAAQKCGHANVALLFGGH
jgi:hypothetical protein